MGKKNGSFGKMYGKVVGKDSDERPGWKGPAFVKKTPKTPAPKKKTAEEEEEPLGPEIPVELQQLLLNIFRDSFSEVLTSDGLVPLLQAVKAALYERDFARAFGKKEYLEAYSVRWSPSRAICYTSILFNLRTHFSEIFPAAAAPLLEDGSAVAGPSSSSSKSSLHAVCFGGGAAEVVGFGGFVRYLRDSTTHETPPAPETAEKDTLGALENLSVSNDVSILDLLLVDTAPWQDVVNKLHTGLITPPPLSKYASASARAANTSLIKSGDLSATFDMKDILDLTQPQIKEMIGKKPKLITLLFTLNELYTTSVAKTTAFLLNLTACAPPGTLLLVVDSPGSYSETTIGTEAKKYPMLWLLKHTLLDTEKSRGQESPVSWTTLVTEEAQWFRLPEALRYTIKLESMRYQVHLYRRA